MTRRLIHPTRGKPVELLLEGTPVRAFSSESVAVALHASGHQVLSRSLKYHRPRAFFCLEGHCGACLMRIDGVPNRRACMEPCRDRLEVQAQNAYPSAELDVLEAVDWLFPGGMDHHTLMTSSSLLNTVANKVVRQLAGLGELPDAPAQAPVPAEELGPDVLVIGGGPAGLAAATAAARAGARAVLIDEHHRLGGSLLADPRHGPAAAQRAVEAAQAAGVELRAGTTAIGYFAEDARPALALSGPRGLSLARPRRYLYATGGYAVNRLFANNDRPGVMAARAVGRLVVSHRVKPGQRVCVVGDDDYARVLAGALAEAGCEVLAVDGRDQRVLGARGRGWVTGVEVETRAQRQRLDCDLIAVSATPAPASEGPRQHGCAVELRPEGGGFAVVTDASGRTSEAQVFACGDVCGFAGPEQAARMGERAGRAAAASLETSEPAQARVHGAP